MLFTASMVSCVLLTRLVDSFHGFDKEVLIDDSKKEYYKAFDLGISLNPILNSFQQTVKEYNITGMKDTSLS
jgi:hypothetical protein